jgi:hypothetical protein
VRARSNEPDCLPLRNRGDQLGFIWCNRPAARSRQAATKSFSATRPACPDQLALGIDHADEGRHFDRGSDGVGLVPSTDPGSGRSPAAPPGEGRPPEPWPTGGACRRHEPLVQVKLIEGAFYAGEKKSMITSRSFR